MAKHLFSAYGYAALQAIHQEDGRLFCAAKNEQSATTLNANMPTANFAKLQEEAARQDEFHLIRTRFHRNGLILLEAQPAPMPKDCEKIRLGHLVTLCLGDDTECRHLVGGENEPDSIQGVSTISIAAPLGHALLGSSVGDVVSAIVKNRKVTAEILKIEIPEHIIAEPLRSAA